MYEGELRSIESRVWWLGIEDDGDGNNPASKRACRKNGAGVLVDGLESIEVG
jgi:hypothetical protein